MSPLYHYSTSICIFVQYICDSVYLYSFISFYICILCLIGPPIVPTISLLYIYLFLYSIYKMFVILYICFLSLSYVGCIAAYIALYICHICIYTTSVPTASLEANLVCYNYIYYKFILYSKVMSGKCLSSNKNQELLKRSITLSDYQSVFIRGNAHIASFSGTLPNKQDPLKFMTQFALR